MTPVMEGCGAKGPACHVIQVSIPRCCGAEGPTCIQGQWVKGHGRSRDVWSSTYGFFRESRTVTESFP